ncbi:MAG TPA: DNA polymerase III subunit beta [Actinomycetota bacterium]|nr:DNA polymerase III subunit beta [Actinomycetota bacterium]
MQIECEKEALLEVSQAALRVVSPRANTPVLGGVRITADADGVELAASDLETFITVRGQCSVIEEGSMVIPGRLFGEILRSLPSGRVVLSGGESGARIEGGRAEFQVSTFPVADFARPPSGEVGEPCLVDAAELARALRQVGKAASTDEGRPVLTGVLWVIEGDSLRVVATDSYRLAIAEVVAKEGPAEGHAIIPNRALTEFARHLAGGSGEEVAEVRLGQSQAVLSSGRVQLVTRLIEGEFPNWRRLLPEVQRNRLEMDKEEFGAAVARVGLVAQANTPVKFHLGKEVQLTAAESGVAEAAETVEGATYTGDPMVTAFNPRFFSDGLEGVEGKRAILQLTEPTKPATLTADGQPNFTYLVMPVRLPN